MTDSARYRLGTLAGVLLLLVSCGGDPLASVGIEPMDFPEAKTLERRVGVQVRAAQEAVFDAARSGRKDSVGARLGELGRLYLLYGLTEAARETLLRACAADSLDARWAYYLGQAYRQQGDLTSARTAYQAHNRAAPSAPGLVREAEVLIDLGRDEEASERLERALEIDSTTALAHYLRAQILERSGALAEAARQYERVLRLQPAATVVNYALGMVYRRLGDEARARDLIARRGEGRLAFQDVLIQDMEALRTGSQALAQEGYLYLQRGRLADALRVLGQAVDENPDNGAAQFYLGIARMRVGDASGAMSSFQEALRINPRDEKALYHMGVLAEAQGEIAEAIRLYQAALDVDGRLSDAYLGLARSYWQGGHCEQALPNYEALLRIEPGHPDHVVVRVRRAMCLSRMGAYAEARTALEGDVAGFPDVAVLVDGLVRVLAASPDEAVRDGEQAIRLAETLVGRVDRAETWMVLAMAYAEGERFKEAVAVMDRTLVAAATHPEIVRTYMRLLRREFKAGRPSRLPWPDFLYGHP